MAFWGVYIKPNEPYILHFDDAVPKRLRITQATLGDATRNSPARSIVRCTIGDKPAIAICSLSVKELTCCQLELEFEESHDVIFSVMGPRGVYLAGYLIPPAPTAHQQSIDQKGQDKATMEIVGFRDHDLCEDELGSNKTVKESIDAQNTDIEHSDKNIKDPDCLLKCSRNKNKEGKIITLDQKLGKDCNEDSSNDEDQEKITVLKTHSVFGRLLEAKRCATEKKKKRKRNKKRKLSTSEADEKFDSDSTINLENGNSPDAYEGSHDNVKERKKKSKRSKDSCGKKNKISKIVFMKKMVGL